MRYGFNNNEPIKANNIMGLNTAIKVLMIVSLKNIKIKKNAKIKLTKVLNGEGINVTTIQLSIADIHTYSIFCLRVDEIFNKEVNTKKDKIASTRLPKIKTIFINSSLGVLKAFQILFNNSMIF